MTTLPQSPETPPDRPAVADEFVRRLPGLGLGALRLLLQALQERRGTAGEQPGDAARVQVLDHEINHRLAAA
jgi:hypothetical protein